MAVRSSPDLLLTLLPMGLNQPIIPKLPAEGQDFSYTYASNNNDYLTQQQGTLALMWADLMRLLSQQQAQGTGSWAPLNSPHFTGVPTAPTAASGSNSTQLATTAFVMNAVTAGTAGVSTWNGRTGAVVLLASDVTNVGGAMLASPAFSGVPTAPTATAGNATTQLATTAFVSSAIAAIPPGTNGTVTSITAGTGLSGGVITNSGTIALANTSVVAGSYTNSNLTIDAQGRITTASNGAAGGVTSFNTRTGVVTLTTADVTGAGGAPLASPALTGGPTSPTPTAGDNSTAIATTAFIHTAIAAIPAGVTSITAGTGLSGGTITGTGTIALANTAVTAGSYTATNLTVDAQGRITAASSGSAGGGTVTSITAGAGLSGGTITGSGTIALVTPVAIASGGRGSTTAPTAGQIDIAQSGTAFGAVTMSGDGTITSAGALTVTKTSGTNFSALATATVPLSIANGGRGTSTAPTAGQVSIAQSATAFGSVTLSGDATVTLAGAVTVSGIRSTAVPTLANGYLFYNGTAFVWQTPSGSGTVTSITAGTGLSATPASPITTSGTIALSTPVSIANGGTNATTAAAALTSLGAAPITVSATSAPASPVTGQFWWESAGAQLYIWTGAQWVITTNAGSLSGSFAPLTNPTNGQNNYAPLASPTFTGTATLPQLNLTNSGATVSALQFNGGQVSLTNFAAEAILYAGAYYNGTNWVFRATQTVGLALSYNAANNAVFYYDSGTTGNTFTPTVFATLAPSGTTLNGQLTLPLSTGASQIWLGNASTPWGSITSATAGQTSVAAGAYKNPSGNWIPTTSGASIITLSGGATYFQANTGLTPPTSFSPTFVGFINTTGLWSLGPLAGTSSNSASQVTVYTNASQTAYFSQISSGTSGFPMSMFNASAASVGAITCNATSTAYGTTSDGRLKTNFAPFLDGRRILDQLPIQWFDWISTGERSVGVVTQEVKDIYPEAIHPGRGEWGEDNFLPQMVDFSKYVPLLIQALQDAHRRIDALQDVHSRIAALEARLA